MKSFKLFEGNIHAKILLKLSGVREWCLPHSDVNRIYIHFTFSIIASSHLALLQPEPAGELLLGRHLPLALHLHSALVQSEDSVVRAGLLWTPE